MNSRSEEMLILFNKLSDANKDTLLDVARTMSSSVENAEDVDKQDK